MSSFFLHLLRHGAPEIPGRMIGHTDVASTAAGIEACRLRARHLDIDHIVSSDLSRAERAAMMIADERDLPLTVDPRWRELHFGDWEGLSPRDLDEAAIGAFWDDPDASPPPRGECWSDLARRVTAALTDFGATNTLVVTHGGAMRATLTILCGLSQRQSWAFDLPYAARLTLRVWPGSPSTAQIVALDS